MFYSSTDSSDNQSNSSNLMRRLPQGPINEILQRNQYLRALRFARDLRMEYYGIAPPTDERIPLSQEEFTRETAFILNQLAQLDQINLGPNPEPIRNVTRPIEAEGPIQHIRERPDPSSLLFANFQMKQEITRSEQSQQQVTVRQTSSIVISPPASTRSCGCCK